MPDCKNCLLRFPLDDGTVVVRVKKGRKGMAAQRYGVMMEERRQEVLTVDHFERRLTEEISGLRQESMTEVAALRQDMTESHAALRQEIAGLRQAMLQGDAGLRLEIAGLRQDMLQGDAGLRVEIAGLRQDMIAGRFELLKWSFVFWVGQVLAVAALLRFMRP